MEKVCLYTHDSGSLIELNLSTEDADRASNDTIFASSLLQEALNERNRRNQEPPNQETAMDAFNECQESTVETNEDFEIEYLDEETFVAVSSCIRSSSNPLPQVTDREETESDGVGSLYRWSDKTVLLLLDNYRAAEAKFSSGKEPSKKIWAAIAALMNAEGHALTGPQCAAKLRSLKKTYKSIKSHNNKSGNNRKTWQFFTIMDEIFAKKAWRSPLALASSSGLSVMNASGTSTEVECNQNATSLLIKRMKQRDEHEKAKQSRHEERIEMDRQVLALLKKIAENT